MNEHTLSEAVDLAESNRTDFATVPSMVIIQVKLLSAGGSMVSVRSEVG